MALIINEMDKTNKVWMKPAIDYLASEYSSNLREEIALSAEQIDDLLGWEY